MFKIILALSGLMATATHAHEPSIEATLARMTLAEKVSMLGGVNHMDTRSLPHLGIPSIKMTDGPLGLNLGQATSFPSGLSIGATFDPELAREFAIAIAEEARFKGRNMLLGPCVNINRNPFGGRNFESYGEDPYLMSRLAETYVEGIQSRGLMASVKHLAANDQEFERMTINANVPLRALFEIHLPAFEAAVNAGSWTVMSAYNRINGSYASENNFLQNTVLKDRFGFKGFVVSDWGATHSVVEAANGGLDLEMPSGLHFGDQLIAAVNGGAVSQYVIDDKVRRILRAMHGIGLMGAVGPLPLPAPKGPGSHDELNLKIAQESLVLLKNENKALPLQGIQSIAVLGPNAMGAPISGGGSSQVVPYKRPVTPLAGFQARAKSTMIRYARGIVTSDEAGPAIPEENLRPAKNTSIRGLKAEYFPNMNLEGEPLVTRIDRNIDFRGDATLGPKLQTNMSIRWTGFVEITKSALYRFTTLSDDGVRLYVNGQKVIDNWTDHGPTLDAADVPLKEGDLAELRLEFYQNSGGVTMSLGMEESRREDALAEAVKAASTSEAAVIFAGLGNYLEGEGNDKETLDLPQGQVELIEAVAAVNPRTIVVLSGGNPLNFQPWLGKVQAVVHAWYAGQEGGAAMADLLLGNINPSGKLPITFLKRWEDSPAFGNYPGSNGQVNYEEGVFVGYRHFDAKSIEPEFPFGFGLSYTTFSVSDLKVKVVNSSAKTPRIEVSARVTNTGDREGSEVVQLYVGEKNPSLPRPPRELKGFQKVKLGSGESKAVSMVLEFADFAFFQESTMAWQVNAGEFGIFVGNSSRNLPLEAKVELR